MRTIFPINIHESAEKLIARSTYSHIILQNEVYFLT